MFSFLSRKGLMGTETTTYTVIGGDVLVLSTDPERVKFVTEALKARYDWAWWRAEAQRFERGWNNEGEQHRVTRQALESLQKRYEEGLYAEAEPLRERLRALQSVVKMLLEDLPEIAVEWPELPPVGPQVKEDPEKPQPLG